MFELQRRIEEKKKSNSIQIMAHMVLGYPSWEENYRMVDAMVRAKVEIIELQIPFSEPMADGPLITGANQKALKGGATPQDCLEFAEKCSRKYPETSFVFMSYTNIPYRYGFQNFVRDSMKAGVLGCILPDLPPELGGEYIRAAKAENFSPIHILTPATSPERMRKIDEFSEGMLYCMGRVGVTGKQTEFNESVSEYLALCKQNTRLPLALGFGIRTPENVAFLKGKAEIAVLGSKLVELIEKNSAQEIESFLKSLRPELFESVIG